MIIKEIRGKIIFEMKRDISLRISSKFNLLTRIEQGALLNFIFKSPIKSMILIFDNFKDTGDISFLFDSKMKNLLVLKRISKYFNIPQELLELKTIDRYLKLTTLKYYLIESGYDSQIKDYNLSTSQIKEIFEGFRKEYSKEIPFYNIGIKKTTYYHLFNKIYKMKLVKYKQIRDIPLNKMVKDIKIKRVEELKSFTPEEKKKIFKQSTFGWKTPRSYLLKEEVELIKERELQIVEAINKNISIKKIREEFDTNASESTRIRKRYNLPKLKTREVMVERRKKIKEMINKFSTITEIRTETGCNNSTIYDMLKEMGISREEYTSTYKQKKRESLLTILRSNPKYIEEKTLNSKIKQAANTLICFTGMSSSQFGQYLNIENFVKEEYRKMNSMLN